MHQGLIRFERRIKQEEKPRDLRHLLCVIAVQRIESNPFHQDIIERVRTTCGWH